MRNELVVVAGSASDDLARSICEHLQVPLVPVETRKFYNDNTFVRIQDNVREADVFVVQTSCPPVNDNLMELLMLINAAKGASARRITAVTPHFPYQQSDKKDEPRICITARLSAHMLETAGADRVLTLDLHASQIQGFFDRPVDHLTAVPILTEFFAEQEIPDLVAVATDVGRANLVRQYARRLNCPLAIIDKHRLNDMEVEALHVIGDVEGKNAIVFDDLVGTGGSLIAAARLLKEHGVKDVYAGAIHGVLGDDAVNRLDQSMFRQILLTDTIPVAHKLGPNSKIRVLSVAGLLAKAIRRIHEGESVSALFV